MAKRTGPPARGPKDGEEDPPPDEPGKRPGAKGTPPPAPKPAPRKPAPPPADSVPPDDLSESNAVVFLSESEVQRLDESQTVAPADNLTESSAVVFMTESDVQRLDAPAPVPAGLQKAPPPQAPPPPGPPRPPKTGPVAAPPKKPGLAKPAATRPATPPPEPQGKGSLVAIIVAVLLSLLITSAGGYALVRMKENDFDQERAALTAKLDEARTEAKASEDRLSRALEGQVAAKDEEVKRARDETATVRRSLEESERNGAAERRKIEDDFKANEETLKQSLAAEREAEVRQAEKRERDRATRDKLDIERRAGETIDRFQALIDESEKRSAAEEQVLRKEARAEILRREALLRKQFEEEKTAFEAEKAKAIELESQKLEEKLRAEFETERGGFMKGSDESAGTQGEGIDLEAAVSDHLKGHLGGSAEYRLFEGFRESDQPLAKRYRDEGIFKLRYDVKAGDSFEVLVVPRVRVDDNGLAEGVQDTFEERQLHRPIFALEEGWVLGRFGSFDVKLGKQIFAWGTGDIINPTDIANPVDYTDLIDSEKIGVPALDASFYLGESTRIRLISIPTFTPSRLPLPGERFSPLPPEGLFIPTPLGPLGPLPIAERDFPPRSLADAQWAARASTSFQAIDRGFDVSFTYFHGFNRLPFLTFDPSPDPALPVEVTPRYNRIDMIGADGSTTISDFEVHGEVAQFITESKRDDDYLQYVIGGHYTRGDVLLAKDEVRLILEYAGDWTEHAATDETIIDASSFSRAFKSAVLGRVVYKPINHLEFQTTAAVLVRGAANAFIQPEVSYEIGNHTKIKMGLDLLNGPEDTFFGQFYKEDRFWMSLKLSF